MFQNNVFEKKWKIVEETFRKFQDSGVLPLTVVAGKDQKTVTEESLRKQIDAIHDEIFTIAVCGQVKAGKSTLLNSLFFGDDVLPVFDTPMTAKLTFLEYQAGSPGFKVEFYSVNEWNELRSIMEEDDSNALQQLDERCQYCAENFGVYPQKWIGHPPVLCSKLTDLAQYVSVPKNGNAGIDGCGKYTPFVKLVKIHLPHENLKNLRIVDTPGLNDSNIINSSQTTEWVKNAHAVVYVLDVTGAHEPDILFFQKYFPSSAADARIFVQNKIDSNPDAASVKESIRQYGQQQVYRDLGLFGENETICSYSGLLALRKSKIEAGKKTSEEEDWAYQYDWIDENFDPDPDHLQEQLSRKLYQRSGCIRISRVLGEFLNLAMEKQRQFQAEREEKNEQARACSLEQKKLEEKISKLKDFCKAINEYSNETLKNADKKLYKTIEDLKNSCRDCNDKIAEKMGRKLESMQHTADIKTDLPRIFIKAIGDGYYSLSDKIRKAKHSLYQFLEDQKDRVNELATSYGVFEDFASAKYIETNYGKQIDDIIGKLCTFSSDLSSHLPNAFINLFTRMYSIRAKARESVDKSLGVLFADFEKICKELQEEELKQVRNYLDTVSNWGEERKGNLEEVKKQSSDKKNLQKQYYEEAEKLQKQVEQLNQHINGLKNISESIQSGED